MKKDHMQIDIQRLSTQRRAADQVYAMGNSDDYGHSGGDVFSTIFSQPTLTLYTLAVM